MSALIIILALLIFGPIVYAGQFLFEGIRKGNRQQTILGWVSVTYVILIMIWIFVCDCGKVFF